MTNKKSNNVVILRLEQNYFNFEQLIIYWYVYIVSYYW